MIAQKSFTVYFRKDYGNKYMEYPLFGTGNRGSSGGSGSWYYKFRDALLQEMIAGKLNVAVQAYRPAILFLNGGLSQGTFLLTHCTQ